MWCCPHCRQELTLADHRLLRCPAGHSFDRAREGYVNLLPANRKHSREPGDSKEMIAARRRVHDAALYQPLAAGMAEKLQALHGEISAVLDLGCGEGYYSGAIMDTLPWASLYGVDISKPAVRLAARRNPAGNFAVASAFDVPLADASMDLAVSVFAPASADELNRLLRPGGYYFKVVPAPEHLLELRELLYDQPRVHKAESQLLEGFEELATTHLEYRIEIERELLGDLVAMTPYAHRGQRENRGRLNRVERLSLGMAFNLSLQRR